MFLPVSEFAQIVLTLQTVTMKKVGRNAIKHTTL